MRATSQHTADGRAISACLAEAARRLARDLARLHFGPPVACVYNPLDYAGEVYAAYLRRFANSPKRVVLLGMNPGPFGMVQTGVPFGDTKAVREWLKLSGTVAKPDREHPRRRVTGFACPRPEISGSRLWGLFADRFGPAENFFSEHIVLNYCPLAFVESTGRNRTPDKLPAGERKRLFEACDEHLRRVIGVLAPEWLIGIGDFAWRRAEAVFPDGRPKLGRILHPSPASPAANRDWAGTVARQLVQLGVWRSKPGIAAGPDLPPGIPARALRCPP